MLHRQTLRRIVGAVLVAANALFAGAAAAQEKIAGPMLPTTTSDSPLDTVLAIATNQTPRDEQRFWFNMDYMFAFLRGTNVPTLVTTSPVGTSRAQAGVIGAPGTSTLFGDVRMDDGLRSGIRWNTGWWFRQDPNFGIEAGFIAIEGQSSLFSANSDQFPILARPHTDATNGTQQAVLVAFPGSSKGSIDAHVTSGNFYGFNLDVTEKALDEGWFRVVALFGYKYYRYEESLGVRQTLITSNPNFVPGTTAIATDSFTTQNTFNGFDMGFRSQYFWDRLSLELLAKVAVGAVERRVAINGDQTVNVPGFAPVIQQGGVLAVSSNSGQFNSHDWKAIPEFGVTLGWQIRPNMSVRLGYSFLLLSGIARAADQIDTTLNQNLLPGGSGTGPKSPVFSLQRTEMWIQSINLGFEWTF
jgi:hypothetical protein